MSCDDEDEEDEDGDYDDVCLRGVVDDILVVVFIETNDGVEGNDGVQLDGIVTVVFGASGDNDWVIMMVTAQQRGCER